MKNPPDYFVLALLGITSFMGFLVTIYMVISFNEGKGSYVALRAFGAVICGIASTSVVAIAIYSEFIKRPYRVEVGEDINLFWKYKEPKNKPYSSVANLFIEPSAPMAFWTKRTGGSIGFKDEKMRYGFSYEIVKAVEQQYVERFGHSPPLPAWAERKKK